MLRKAQEYARNACEAVDLAGKTRVRAERNALMHMAETWLHLAEAALEHNRFMSAARPAEEDRPEATPAPPA